MAASMHNFLSVGMESFVQHTSFEDPSAAPPPHTAASDMEVAHLCGTCSQQSSFFFLKTQAQHPPPLHTAASDTEVAHLSVERSQQNFFFFQAWLKNNIHYYHCYWRLTVCVRERAWHHCLAHYYYHLLLFIFIYLYHLLLTFENLLQRRNVTPLFAHANSLMMSAVASSRNVFSKLY